MHLSQIQKFKKKCLQPPFVCVEFVGVYMIKWL